MVEGILRCTQNDSVCEILRFALNDKRGDVDIAPYENETRNVQLAISINNCTRFARISAS
jgi:hypothetical protein